MSKDSVEWVTVVAPEIIEINDGTQLRIEVTKGGEKVGLSIRQWYRGTDKDSDEKLKVGPWLPTKKGVWIPIKLRQDVLKSLMLVIQNYEVKMQERL